MIGGIFVGGSSSRMGSPKGLLRPPSGESSIVERWTALLDGLRVPHVLVGRRPEYAHLGDGLLDSPPRIGPLGGLHALALHAASAGHSHVLAVACDLPFVSEALLRRLIDAPPAAIVAPRRDGRWEPLFARYDVGSMVRTLPERIARSAHRLQDLLDALGSPLPTSPEEDAALSDWDSPSDVRS